METCPISSISDRVGIWDPDHKDFIKVSDIIKQLGIGMYKRKLMNYIVELSIQRGWRCAHGSTILLYPSFVTKPKHVLFHYTSNGIKASIGIDASGGR